MRFHEGEMLLKLLRGAHIHGQTHMGRHATHAFELHHARVAVGQTDRASDVVVDRIVHFLGQTAIQFQPITLHVHHAEICREVGAISRRVPSRACR